MHNLQRAMGELSVIEQPLLISLVTLAQDVHIRLCIQFTIHEQEKLRNIAYCTSSILSEGNGFALVNKSTRRSQERDPGEKKKK